MSGTQEGVILGELNEVPVGVSVVPASAAHVGALYCQEYNVDVYAGIEGSKDVYNTSVSIGHFHASAFATALHLQTHAMNAWNPKTLVQKIIGGPHFLQGMWIVKTALMAFGDGIFSNMSKAAEAVDNTTLQEYKSRVVINLLGLTPQVSSCKCSKFILHLHIMILRTYYCNNMTAGERIRYRPFQYE